jgi:hypothetical protein
MIKTKIDTFILIILGILFILPHLPYYSYGIARFIDFLHLFGLIFITLYLYRKKKIAINTYVVIILICLYIINIFLGNFNGLVLGLFSLKDLTDLYRPILWLTSVFLGVYLSCYDKYKLFKLIQFLSIFSLIIALFQKMGIDIFYKIYSGGQHIISNRATGIAQDFADYSLIQMIGACVFFHFYKEDGKIKNIFLGLILSLSVLLSTSKAGMALMFGITTFFFASIFFHKRTTFFFRFILIMFLSISAFWGYKLIKIDDKFNTELTFLLRFDENLPSIYERQRDYNFVINEIFEQDCSLTTFWGFGGTSRASDSYIEVAWLTVLYRTGIIGLIIYYLLFFLIFSFLYKQNSSKYFAVFLICSIFIDIFAAMTNRLIGMNLLFLIYGYISTNNINSNSIINKNSYT